MIWLRNPGKLPQLCVLLLPVCLHVGIPTFHLQKHPMKRDISWIRPQPLWFITVWRCFCFWLRTQLTFHTHCRERRGLNQYLRWWCCWRENFSQKPNPKTGSEWTLCVRLESYRAAGDCSGSTFLHLSAGRKMVIVYQESNVYFPQNNSISFVKTTVISCKMDNAIKKACNSCTIYQIIQYFCLSNLFF